MPKKKYLVTLSDTERDTLEHLLRNGQHATRKVTRARLLLKAAEGWDDAAIAHAVDVGRATVERTRQRFVAEGLGALEERPRPGKQPKLDAKAAAHLIVQPVVPRRRAANAGPCNCWPIVSWPWGSPSRIHTRVSAGC
jgi:Winged helix-turn helix